MFTDKANTALLNQILLTATRPLDPKATDYDLGFKLQVMYGSDARYVQYLGEGDYWINELDQITPVEVWGVVHTPWLFSGGIDIKAGQWVTLEGAETIDPTTNYFYSHSYIFNFGIPLVETGVMTISHVDPLVDIYCRHRQRREHDLRRRQRCPSGVCGRHRAQSAGRQPHEFSPPPISGRKLLTPTGPPAPTL